MESKIKASVTEAILWLEMSEKDGRPVFDGPLSSINNIVVKKLNLSMGDIVRTDIMADYGDIIDDKVGTGMIGYLFRNECQLGLYPTTPTYKTIKHIDFLGVVINVIWKIYSGSPIFKEDSRFAIVSIFTWEVWLSIWCVFWIFSFIRWGLSKFLPQLHEERIRDVFFKTFSIFLNQDSSGVPSKRHDVLSWGSLVFTCYFINLAFSALLLSKVMLADKPIFFDQVRDIFMRPNMPVVASSENIQNFIKQSVSGDFAKLRVQIERTYGFRLTQDMDLMEIVEQIESGEMVSIIDNFTPLLAYEFLGLCKPKRVLRFSKFSVHEPTFQYPMSKSAPKHLRTTIRKITQPFVESGCFSYDLRKHTIMGDLCLRDVATPQTEETIDIRKITFPLLIFFAGILISIIAKIISFFC